MKSLHPIFYTFYQIWIKFDKRVASNVLSDTEFRENRLCESRSLLEDLRFWGFDILFYGFADPIYVTLIN